MLHLRSAPPRVPRQALDALLTLSKMPSRGVPIDLSSIDLDIPKLKLYWSAGRVSRAEVSRGIDIITERVYGILEVKCTV